MGLYSSGRSGDEGYGSDGCVREGAGGSEWNERGANKCQGQTTPISGSKYPGALPPAVAMVRRALSKIKKPVTLLDITSLSQLRKDGHPSIYGNSGGRGLDCTHWCVAGVPDTWNQILFQLISH
ncbi:hypothetical protein RHGRI_009806 [Rhododendron griersonianum]|uniref:Trichome birefringence-like C-terminal domain-containing protein n=1 Tax=Rhododendron griersonianum TaxID=479676 RepID=A0AAV6KGS6_9ERIC|nr:hypothetical protein RHGRI_009806 [Rhododendron griersonianum]